MNAGARRFLSAVLLLAALPFAAAAQPGVGYPKLAAYSMARGDGTPYVRAQSGSPWTWPIDSALVAVQARWDYVIVDASPFTEYRPDVLRELRRLNPDIKLFAYTTTAWWANPTPAYGDTTVNFPWKVWQAVRNTNGILYSRNGGPHQGANTNLANRGGTFVYPTALALADTIANMILRSGAWDGLFVDGTCMNIWWAQSPTDSIDYVRAGYRTPAEFNAGYAAGQRAFSQRLRDRLGPRFYLCGNGGPSGERDIWSGWMREDFPNQEGGTWERNMIATASGDPGYLSDDTLYVPPAMCWLGLRNADSMLVDNLRRTRFVLGSATLGDGVADITGWEDDPMRGFRPWWLDEYAVELPTGVTSTRIADKGWLGPARDRAYPMLWVGPGPDAVANADFEADVTTGWTFTHAASVPAEVSRDSTTSATGLCSARLHVDSRGAYDWYATLASVGSVPLSAGQCCSATFWARASAARSITVAVGSASAECDSRTVTLDTEWHRYQVVLRPASACLAQLHLSVGARAGDVWVDDVHLQVGVMNVYRRDFRNGIVLVNPSPETVFVPLGATYRRILGAAAPTVNDGAAGSEAAVTASDALFLIGNGDVAPATVHDLRVVR